MSEGSTPSESKMGQNEIWEGLAKVFDGARNEAVKLPGGHELKHGEVWGALSGAALFGAVAILVGDQTRQVLDTVRETTGFSFDDVSKPSVLEFARDIIGDIQNADEKAALLGDGTLFYGPWDGSRIWDKAEPLGRALGLDKKPHIENLIDELSKMEIHRQFRNITSLALAGAGIISLILATATEKAKERVVWSDTIGPLLAKGIRAMNNVSEQP